MANKRRYRYDYQGPVIFSIMEQNQMKKYDETANVKIPFVRSANNYNTEVVSDLTGLSCPEPSLAVQDQAEETDINYIMKKFGQGYQLPEAFDARLYPDFTQMTDFHTALNAVREAGEMFMQMPAELRAKFDNDPAKLIAFVEDEKNRGKAEDMGLVPRPPAEPPVPEGSGNKPGPDKETPPKKGEVSPGTVTTREGTVPPQSGSLEK